jgi:radical SAM superfamily enzyme YgiQ (UPF0313 family)
MNNLKNGEQIQKEPTRVLLIEGGSELEAGIPPNMAIMVGSIKSAGHEVRIFSLNDYKSQIKTGDEVRVDTLQVPPTDEEQLYKLKNTNIKEDFKAMIKEFRPNIVGATATEPTYLMGLSLIKLVEDRKDIFKIVGGAHTTLNQGRVMNESCLDAICISEGHEAVVQLCDYIRDGKMLLNGEDFDFKIISNIFNLWIKQPKTKKIIKNPTKLFDVNKTPLQDWSAWQVPPRASKAMRGTIKKTALVELTRGCPYKCTYCANVFFNEHFKGTDPETGKKHTYYRERSVDRFVEEIIYLRDKHDVEYIYIGDETIMTTSKKRFQDFMDKYPTTAKSNGNGKTNGNGNGSHMKGLPFWCETRPESMTYERVKGFVDVGMAAVNIGVESGNEEFRRTKLHRNVTNERMIRGIADAIKANANIGANVIIGFPGETKDMIFETIDLVRAARQVASDQLGEEKAIEKLSSMIHLYQPYSGTPLRQEAIDMGLIPEDYISGDYRMDSIGTGKMSGDELKGLQRTFNLYVDSPKQLWDDIKIAEKFTDEGNAKFAEYAKKYQLKHFGRTSFS